MTGPVALFRKAGGSGVRDPLNGRATQMLSACIFSSLHDPGLDRQRASIFAVATRTSETWEAASWGVSIPGVLVFSVRVHSIWAFLVEERKAGGHSLEAPPPVSVRYVVLRRRDEAADGKERGTQTVADPFVGSHISAPRNPRRGALCTPLVQLPDTEACHVQVTVSVRRVTSFRRTLR